MDIKNIVEMANGMAFEDLDAAVKAMTSIRKARREDFEASKKDAKAEDKVAKAALGLGFIKTKTIGDTISYVTADGEVGFMKIKNIKLETGTVSGTKLDGEGNVILSDSGKPAGVWRYFHQLDPAQFGELIKASDEAAA